MIEERYLAATRATSLRDMPHLIGQVDLIKASGMSHKNIAAHYLRLISNPTKEDMKRVYAALLWVVDQRKLQSGADAIVLALEWLLDSRCKVCAGAGVVVKGERDHKCPRCKGEKVRKEPGNRDAQLLIDYVMGCRAAHGGRMFKLLR
ncbi:hypothetical protein [Pantoea sp. 18069]|uniref:hypothetical protein n=1 Tax=Pantoea sp. 18069 TaxID=2681415 RepID=UPI00135BCC51|nr:hypothetical protein [Pantoea sp. 18069]